MRKRIFIAVLAALLPSALLIAAHGLLIDGLPFTPAHVFLGAGITCSMARADLRGADRDVVLAARFGSG